MNVSLD